MNIILDFVIKVIKGLDGGTLPNHPDPEDPPGIGGALTQDEIDWVKRMKKEMDDRFTEEEPAP